MAVTICIILPLHELDLKHSAGTRLVWTLPTKPSTTRMASTLPMRYTTSAQKSLKVSTTLIELPVRHMFLHRYTEHESGTLTYEPRQHDVPRLGMGRLSRHKRNDKNRSGFLGHLGRQCREGGILPQRAGELLVCRSVEVFVFDTRAGEFSSKRCRDAS